jgi:hypothetical protein
MDDLNVPTVGHIVAGARRVVDGRPLVQHSSWTL